MAKEMITGFGWKSTPKRFWLLVDLSKAFDTLDWEAIESSLKVIGFSKELRSITAV